MGARNSTPQTVQIENPILGVIELSPTAQKRMTEAQKKAAQAKKKAKCAKKQKEREREKENDSNYANRAELGDDLQARLNKEHGTALLQSETDVTAHRLYKDTQEKQFNKTRSELENVLGKPVYWIEAHADALKQMKDALVRCYNEYKQEPLRCAELSKQYQDFVLKEQFHTILEEKKIEEEDTKVGGEEDTKVGDEEGTKVGGEEGTKVGEEENTLSEEEKKIIDDEKKECWRKMVPGPAS